MTSASLFLQKKCLFFSEEIMRQAGLRHGKIVIAILQVTNALFPQEESLKNTTRMKTLLVNKSLPEESGTAYFFFKDTFSLYLFPSRTSTPRGQRNQNYQV